MVVNFNSDYIFTSNQTKGVASITTTTTSYICVHKTGWYGRVTFWIFSKQIFTCSDCGKILVGKELREFKKKRRCR